MLHEYREEISQLKQNNAHFAKLMAQHDELDHKIRAVEEEREVASEIEFENMKKTKLLIKDEIYAMCIKYKKEQEAK